MPSATLSDSFADSYTLTNDGNPAGVLDDMLLFAAACRAPVTPPISQWVEEHLILPSGPYRGECYRHARHPASRLWFDAIGSGNWNRFAASAPTQNGKTLMCYVAPILYHLFAMRETVVIGLPTMAMAADKWTEDLLPAIEASEFATLLPTTGEGSRGGQVKRAVQFRNGASLRFMAAGGGDKQRAGFTTRILAVTETDGMDEAGEHSREADAIEQLEGRTRAYGASKRVYLECTASVEKGRIWQEILHGTDSRIARPCPHCRHYVTPEREHLVGWEDAGSELEAAEKAFWCCPACGEAWTDVQRREAAQRVVLVHHGQKAMENGRVVGPLPATKTLGFRWSAIDNPFATTAGLGAEEWKSKRAADQENAEKKMRQFVWCLPYDPPEVELTPLDPEELRGRVVATKKGVIPDGCLCVSVGVDTGKRKLHWEAKAILPGGGAVVIEYGIQPVDSDRLGVQSALVRALSELREYFDAGWHGMRPSQVWIDSGYHEHTDAVYEFCKRANHGLPMNRELYRPAKGYGEGQIRMGRYIAPKNKAGDIRYIGKEYHMSWIRRAKTLLVHVNADHWKSEFHQRLAMPAEEPGAIMLYHAASADEHLEYSRHLTAERQIEKWIPGRGTVPVWDRVDRINHFLDAGYLACAAGHFMAAAANSASAEGKTLAQMAAEARGHG